MNSLNRCEFIGTLGRDIEVRQTQSGTEVGSFSLATNRRVKNPQTGDWSEETDWIDIVLFKPGGVAQYLVKGKKIFVSGRLQTRSWTDQTGAKRYRTEIIADNYSLILLGGQGGQGGGSGWVKNPNHPDNQQQNHPPPQRPAAQTSVSQQGAYQNQQQSGGSWASPAADDIPFLCFAHGMEDMV